jgi:hypothetical protein
VTSPLCLPQVMAQGEEGGMVGVLSTLEAENARLKKEVGVAVD